jgi:hypothetical protein
MMEKHTPLFILNTLLQQLGKNKSVTVLKEYASLLEKVIEDFGIDLVPVKDIVEYSKTLAANTNPQVRNAATSLLCVLYKYVGKDLKLLLKDIKESTLKVIETELDKITPIDKSKVVQPKREVKADDEGSGGVSNKNVLDSLIPRSDISKKITTKLLKDINDGKWPEKKTACKSLEAILNEANMKILPNGLNELFTVFKNRLNDGNKNVVRLMVQLLGKFIDALGAGFKGFTKTVSAGLIGNLADKMQMLREDVQICLDKWVTNLGFDTVGPYLPTFLKQDNFEIRTEIFKFLLKYKDQIGKLDLKEYVAPLLLCLQDKIMSVRASAEEVIATSLKYISICNY